MSAAPELNPQSEMDRLNAAADQAIAACGGDLRSTIRSLILANEFLEYEISELFVAVSRSYASGKAQHGLPADADDAPPVAIKPDWFD